MGSDIKKGSLSRLSPSAQPFTLNRPNSSLALNSSVDDWQQYTSFCPSCSLLGQPSSAAPCSYCGGVASAGSFSYGDHAPLIDANTYYSEYPSLAFQAPAGFTCLSESESRDLGSMPITNASQVGIMANKFGAGERLWRRGEKEGTPGKDDKNDILSLSQDASFKQEKSSSEGLKPFGEIPDSSGRKCTDTLVNYIELRPKDIGAECVSVPLLVSRANSSSSTLLHLFPSEIHEDNQRQLKVFPSSGSNALPALDSEPLVAYTNYPQLNPELSKNVGSPGLSAFSNKIASSYKPANMEESHAQLNTKDKEVFQDKLLVDKNKGGWGGNPVSHDAVDLLTMTEPKLQINCPSVASDAVEKFNGTRGGDCVENNGTREKDDSDLDSPCWKGTLATKQSTFEASGPLNTQNVKNGRAICSSLNPLAPQFFPSNDKGSANFCGSESDGHVSLSFPRIACPPLELPSKAHGLQNRVTAGSCFPELRNNIETHSSNDVHVPEKENTLCCNNSSSSSILTSPCMVQPLVVDDCIKSRSHTLMEPNVGGSTKGVKHAAHNASTSVSLLPSDDAFGSSSCRVGVLSDFTGTYGDASKSLFMHPTLDIHTVVDTMNELSELLMQNCSSDLDSLNEHELDIIKRVINNLSMCIRNMDGKRALISEPSNPFASSCLTKLSDHQKCAVKEIQTPRTKTKMVSQKVEHSNENEGQKYYAASFSERVLNIFSTIKDGVENGQCITQLQVMQKMLKEHQMEVEVNPQVLLYRNLWLEAEAELCFMKYKACAMKTKMEQMPIR